MCAYAVPGSERCIVKLLDMYLLLLSPNSLNFYIRALQKFPSDPKKHDKPVSGNQYTKKHQHPFGVVGEGWVGETLYQSFPNGYGHHMNVQF